MKRQTFVFSTAAAMLLLAAHFTWHALAAPATTTRPAPSVPADTVHYEAGAPQLGFLEIQPAQQREQPTLDGLPGNDIGEDHPITTDRTARFVAGGFDSKDADTR